MPYIYPHAQTLQGKAKLGDEECVALIRPCTTVPHSVSQKQGAEVMHNEKIAAGKAIATFKNGRYPSRPVEKHSAFYLGQTSTYIWVMDQ